MDARGRPRKTPGVLSPSQLELAKLGFIPAMDAAALLGRHVSNLYRWIDAGKVTSGAAHGKPRFVEVNSFRAFLASRGFVAMKALDEKLVAMGVPAEVLALPIVVGELCLELRDAYKRHRKRARRAQRIETKES